MLEKVKEIRERLNATNGDTYKFSLAYHDMLYLLDQVESLEKNQKELTKIIARNLIAWDTSKDKRQGLLLEVYLSNKHWYKKLTGEEYSYSKARRKFNIGE